MASISSESFSQISTIEFFDQVGFTAFPLIRYSPFDNTISNETDQKILKLLESITCYFCNCGNFTGNNPLDFSYNKPLSLMGVNHTEERLEEIFEEERTSLASTTNVVHFGCAYVVFKCNVSMDAQSKIAHLYFSNFRGNLQNFHTRNIDFKEALIFLLNNDKELIKKVNLIYELNTPSTVTNYFKQHCKKLMDSEEPMTPSFYGKEFIVHAIKTFPLELY